MKWLLILFCCASLYAQITLPGDISLPPPPGITYSGYSKDVYKAAVYWRDDAKKNRQLVLDLRAAGSGTTDLKPVLDALAAHDARMTAALASISPISSFKVVVSGTTTKDATLTWDYSGLAVTGFKIERSTNGTTWSLLGTTTVSILTYVDRGLTTGNYWYRVRAYKTGMADSVPSNTTSIVAP